MFSIFQPSVPKIDASDVKKAIDAKEDVILFDVRTPGEFLKGHLKGSINIPVEGITENVEKKLTDKNKKIYVYCLSGSRSVHAVNMMSKKGYTQVFDIDHGLLAWRANGYPL